MDNKIELNKIYTPKETRDFLKISESTMKRMIRTGIIEAYKVSGQYRIWGREILRLVSPRAVIKGENAFLGMKKNFKRAIEKW